MVVMMADVVCLAADSNVDNQEHKWLTKHGHNVSGTEHEEEGDSMKNTRLHCDDKVNDEKHVNSNHAAYYVG